MELKHKLLVFASALALAAVVVLVIFFSRPPVLIVTDASFIRLYGEARVKLETRRSSIVLFRWVRAIVIADDAGDDIVQYAIAEVSSRPHCVIFPLRFAQSARIFREQNPEISVVVMEGRYPENANPSSFAISNRDDYFLFKTDIALDFYRAALAAAILDRNEGKRVMVFLDHIIHSQAREAFLLALNEQENPPQASFFTSFSQFSTNEDLSSIVLTGVGFEYLDRYSDVPVIFFSWISPDFMPNDVVFVLNDSPFAQTVAVVRMVDAEMTKGQIPSKILVLPGNGVERGVLRKLRKI